MYSKENSLSYGIFCSSELLHISKQIKIIYVSSYD